MTEGTTLVIGATGFIGKAVAERLARRGLPVIRTARSAANVPADLELDITSDGAVEKCSVLGDIDCVVNCAGLAHQFGPIDPAAFYRVNSDGAVRGMQIARQARARRYVLISSIAVYGEHGEAIVDEDFECRPSGDYAASKYEGELRVGELRTDDGPDVVLIRPSTVIGAGDRGNTARLAASIIKRRFIWIGDGENDKSLVSVDDVAESVARAVAAKGKVGGAFNVSAPPVTMRSIVETIADEAGVKIPKVGIPPAVVDLVFGVNRRTVRMGRLSRIESTIRKFRSSDRFSARRFDAVFGTLAYRPIDEVLREFVGKSAGLF